LRDKNKLEEYLVQTSNPNLKFLPGEGRTTFLANIHHAQKTKVFWHTKIKNFCSPCNH
jgi:MinD-like ATPase involved in chromosome partitioning or flagellar assembly